MTSTSPSPSSSAAAVASTSSPTCTEPFCPSSHFWIGLIGVGFLIIFNVCLIKWRMSWREMGSFCCLFCGVFCCIPSNQNVNTRVQNENVPPARSGQPVTLDQPEILDQPEMFDARMGERALDGLKWEKSMPFSVTRLKNPECSNRTVRKGKAGKSRGNSAREREHDTGSSRLRAAVLVAMPSRLHAQSPRINHTASGGFMRDELAIGLIEMAWTQEDHRSLKRNES